MTTPTDITCAHTGVRDLLMPIAIKTVKDAKVGESLSKDVRDAILLGSVLDSLTSDKKHESALAQMSRLLQPHVDAENRKKAYELCKQWKLPTRWVGIKDEFGHFSRDIQSAILRGDDWSTFDISATGDILEQWVNLKTSGNYWREHPFFIMVESCYIRSEPEFRCAEKKQCKVVLVISQITMGTKEECDNAGSFEFYSALVPEAKKKLEKATNEWQVGCKYVAPAAKINDISPSPESIYETSQEVYREIRRHSNACLFCSAKQKAQDEFENATWHLQDAQKKVNIKPT